MTIIYDCILARYDGGYIYVNRNVGPGFGKELFVELGGVTDKATAIALAKSYLSTSAVDKKAVQVEGYVVDEATMPFMGYSPGDKLAGQMVTSITLKRDGDDLVSATPNLDSPIKLVADALDRRLKRISSGVGNEFGRPTIQYPDTSTGTDTTPPTFSQDDYVTVAYSPPWRSTRNFHLSWLEGEILNAGFTPTEVRLYLYSDSVPLLGPDSYRGSLVFNGGETYKVKTIDTVYPAGSSLLLYVSRAGGGARKLTVNLRGAMI